MITDSDMFGTWNGHGSVAYIVSTCSQEILAAIEVVVLDLFQHASSLYSSRGCRQCKRGYFTLFFLYLRLCMASHFVSANSCANSLYSAQGLKIFHADHLHDASMTGLLHADATMQLCLLLIVLLQTYLCPPSQLRGCLAASTAVLLNRAAPVDSPQPLECCISDQALHAPPQKS